MAGRPGRLVLLARLLMAELGLALHGPCIRLGWLGALSRPIDGARRPRGRPLFGANTTWRGIVAVALGAAAGYALQAALRPAALGTPLSVSAAPRPAPRSSGRARTSTADAGRQLTRRVELVAR